MPSELLRASAVYIATGDTTSVYHSVEEVPLWVRQKFVRAALRMETATILIADRRTAEQLLKARGEPAPPRKRRRALLSGAVLAWVVVFFLLACLLRAA